MKTALILMTILGCDDGVNECEYVETAPERFISISLCDAAAETVLERYSNISYPTAVAVCQEPAQDGSVAASPAAPTAADVLAEEPPETEKKTLAARAMETVREVLPGTAQIKMIFETPIHVVSDSYSWVAKKLVR
ncbi:hypothetical protein [Rhizobium sp. CECT 9324]|jgi:hypothetical protein|uniref:hypothetical protein n=1 Tax=Rhizobium sp. CECT 9324 TaxID=2845820 RepID=UPI000DDFF0A0|nr:hypothetical protein [Rhizobium sp. CECT 9324]CAH0340648.1 hypothetical protein RHI9324_02328 [Rhizobium sp. CECT 9324]